ncbi:hypothetical protein GCM10010104_24090 [Streptomyces indiaensis]|uniref:Uncharacterized protein n=1 Tax=Streptomyces indiaensis TaxID=284033 RepID=A0ABN3DFU7_9ACTN
MTLSVSTGQAVDPRVQPVDEVLDRVQRSLQVGLLPDTMVRKRRSVGARTDRDTWVRIERRLLDKISDQGWNGTEGAACLKGIAQPEWHGCVVWRATDGRVMWRADETELLPGAPIGNAILSEAPELPDDRWGTLNASLDALAAQSTNRVATPDTDTITQALVTESICGVLSGDLDTTIEQWVPAHADLNWANMTAPGVQSLRLGGLGPCAAGAGLGLAVGEFLCRPGSGRSRMARAPVRLREPGRQADDAIRLLEDPRAVRAPGRPSVGTRPAHGRRGHQGASDLVA